MGQLNLKGVTKSFGSAQVIQPTDLTIDDGDFVVFVGPSGCGKSTMLRMIAGLEEITSGTIEIDGKVVNDLAPVKRGISMVFQSYALYPHMTVYENIAFPLRVAKEPETVVNERVQRAADVLQLGPRLHHKPGALSGGQRQRVAIGRAIVREPSVFLFDEPLSNLDAALRGEMRVELSRLHQQLGNTMIYVTHDQIEAMTMADKIVVLRDGLIEQAGSPLDLYHRPDNKFVASFIGNPSMNFMGCVVTGSEASGVRVRLNDGSATGVIPVDGDVADGSEMILGIRPESLRPDHGEMQIDVETDVVERLGDQTIIYSKLAGGGAICVVGSGTEVVRANQPLRVGFDPADAHLFRADGTALARRVDLSAIAEVA